MKNETPITLSKEQIQSLFYFAKSKYVHYKDVQLEVVDHLASAIEDEMNADNSLSFDAALRRVYGRFPITGFAQFVEEKTKAVDKFWRRLFFKQMVSFFTIPKIIISIFLFLTVLCSVNYFRLQAVLFFIIIFMIGSFINKIKFNKKVVAAGFKPDDYLIIQRFKNIAIGASSIPILYPIWLCNLTRSFDRHPDISTIEIFAISFIITLLMLWLWTSTIYSYEILRNEIRNKYGHLGLSFA